MAEPRFVVGVDFGTTFSGFAYAHRSEPENVHLFFDWPDAAKPYCKTQTSLLYSPEGHIEAWGWTALNKYSQVLSSPACNVWHFRKQFKLLLEDKDATAETDNLPLGMRLRLRTSRLITDYLTCISGFVVEHLRVKYGAGFSKKDVQWCVTVPACWSEDSKGKMQMYAEWAAMVKGKYCPRDSDASNYPLKIILEPEAASFYCQKQLTDSVSFQRGDKFIVADIGGGTIDLVVHRKGDVRYSVHEQSQSMGVLGGGTYVDKNFFKFLKEKIGCFDEFDREDPASVHKIVDWWFGPHGKSNFNGTCSKEYELPRKLSKAWKKHDKEEGILRGADYYGEVLFTEEDLRAMFDTEVKKVIDVIQKKVMEHPDVKYVFLVGGFAENDYLVKCVKEQFQCEGREVIAPPNPGAAICKGAVAIGFGTELVLSRISKWYGIVTFSEFEHGVDPPEHRFFTDNGKVKCQNVFCAIVVKGESVTEGHCASKVLYPVCSRHRSMRVSLFSSSDVSAPGCEKLQEYFFDINEDLHLGTDRAVHISMYFGRASIEVFAQRINFGKNRQPEKLYSVEFAHVVDRKRKR